MHCSFAVLTQPYVHLKVHLALHALHDLTLLRWAQGPPDPKQASQASPFATVSQPTPRGWQSTAEWGITQALVAFVRPDMPLLLIVCTAMAGPMLSAKPGHVKLGTSALFS